MRSFPLWFDSDGVACFGWCTAPADLGVRGAVVVCPPIATELISAHDTLRQLTERLASRGFATLRCNYPGTGDSADLANLGAVDLVQMWQGVARAGIHLLRDLGAPWVGAIGMRIGATILGSAPAEELGADAVVYWDPCPTGASFLRQQGKSFKMYFSGPGDDAQPDGTIPIPGYVYGREVVQQLTALRFHPDQGAEHRDILVLTRQAPDGHPLRKDLPNDQIEWAQVAGQPELLDISSTEAVIPERALASVADWLTDRAPTALFALRPDRLPQPTVDLGDGIHEHALSLGPLGLFGIVTEPATRRAASPLVVFVNVAAELHIGPARQWVDLARLLALRGFTSLRLDLSGIGDSPSRPGQVDRTPFSASVPEDITGAVRALRPDDAANFVLVGLCSGAKAAIDTGGRFGAAGIIAINPVPEVEAARFLQELERSRQSADSAGAVDRLRVAADDRTTSWKMRLRTHFPSFLWRPAHLVHLWRSPAADFELPAARVGHTLVMCSPRDATPFDPRGRWILERLRRQGRFEFRTLAELDHSLLTPLARDHARRLVLASMDRWFSDPAGDTALPPQEPADPPVDARRD